MQCTLNDESNKFKWVLILFEEFAMNNDKKSDNEFEDYILNIAAVDLILGNWMPHNKPYYNGRIGPRYVLFGVDRSLGCIYPEDKLKLKENVTIIPFGNELKLLWEEIKKKKKKKKFNNIDDVTLWQHIMDLKLYPGSQQSLNLLELFDLIEVPSFFDCKHLKETMKERLFNLMQILPYYPIEFELLDLNIPCGRDGHCAVSTIEHNAMFVLGGNSVNGPLNDCWKLNLTSSHKYVWTKMNNFPKKKKRYSFTADVFNDSHIIIFGGGDEKNFFFNDIQVYNIEKNCWDVCDQNNDNKCPPQRCRHSSILVYFSQNESKLFIFGGYGSAHKKKKMNDIWSISLSLNEHNVLIKSNWKHEGNLLRSGHKMHSFIIGSKVYLIGGFGRSLMKIQAFDIMTNKVTLVTTTGLTLDKKDFSKSKSLVGFGMIHDKCESRILLFGGGNKSGITRSVDSSFGNGPGSVIAEKKKFES